MGKTMGLAWQQLAVTNTLHLLQCNFPFDGVFNHLVECYRSFVGTYITWIKYSTGVLAPEETIRLEIGIFIDRAPRFFIEL